MNSNIESESTFRDVLTVAFRHKFVILLVFFVVMMTVYIGVELRTPTYRAYVKILVSGKMQKDVEYQRELGQGSITKTQMSLVQSKPILERTVRALNLDKRPVDYEKFFATPLKKILINYNARRFINDLRKMTPQQREEYLSSNALGELNKKINIMPAGDTSIFIIGVTDYSPQAAAQIANVLSRSYIIFDIEQQIAALQLTYGEKNATIMKLKNHIKQLEESLDGRLLPDIEALGPASVKIITQAEWANPLPMKPSKSLALILALVMSMSAGIMLAYGFEYFDQTVKSGQDVEKHLKIPFLGSVPERDNGDDLIANAGVTTRYAHSLQNLSNYMYLFMKNNSLKSLLLSDAEGSNEPAILTANLGVCLARSGHSVLIVDADFRKPSMNNIFDAVEGPGLSDLIEEKCTLEDAIRNIDSNLNILTTGSAVLNPIVLLDSEVLLSIFNKLKELYDVVLINCADIKNYTDAVLLSTSADGFVLILNEGKVKRQIIKHFILPMEHEKINIIGAILAKRKYVIPEIIYKFT